MDECPIESSSLNLVFLTDIVEHTPNPIEFLQLVADRMAVGGVALVTFLDIRSIGSLYWYMLSRLTGRPWIWRTCHIPLHTWEFTPVVARRCFGAAGFSVLDYRRRQPHSNRSGDLRLRLLEAPARLLQFEPFARLFGTQMEFILQKRP